MIDADGATDTGMISTDSREADICIWSIAIGCVQNFFESRVKDVKDVSAAEKSLVLCREAAPAAVHNLKRFSHISTQVEPVLFQCIERRRKTRIYPYMQL